MPSVLSTKVTGLGTGTANIANWMEYALRSTAPTFDLLLSKGQDNYMLLGMEGRRLVDSHKKAKSNTGKSLEEEDGSGVGRGVKCDKV
ncbi:hypothetical protein CBR_g23836 [Chara braunii]|uniref:Uncharacterized protein n=1 Tax=Chara braunii TaxID=69332 RepID=A0A388JVT0_CHABU|nr:hypothetical protein CBR_g23836 [Chara braunii]|eukprot:GBG61885.1 hypothetical protein CBR_g23836 [Chara braunii]